MDQQERIEYVHRLELEQMKERHRLEVEAAKQSAFESNMNHLVSFTVERTRQEILRMFGLPNDIVK